MKVDKKKIDEFIDELQRTAVDIYGLDDLKERMYNGETLTIKFGADPSRPDLHLGHTVPLRMLKKFQDLGHNVIFLIGDFTAMIGDPSGRSKTRPALTFEETRRNSETYYKQVGKVLDITKAKVQFNSEWLSKMSFKDVLELGGKYTLARLLERDDFALRYRDNVPIGIHELFYPLMQGYDSVVMHADVEIGGTDQTFNVLVGRELQKDYGQRQQVVITFPLLPGLDGVNKMSKSLDNYIGIDEDPGKTFERCMKVPDNLMGQYLKLTTDLKPSEYADLLASDIRKAHFLYAKTIVTMYHGAEKAKEAEERYNTVASGAVPQDVKTVVVTEKAISPVNMLLYAKFADSSSNARKLIQNKGVKINGVVVTDALTPVEITDDLVISKGKANFAKFIVK